MSVEIGIDSKPFEMSYSTREGETKSFKSMLGVAIVSEDPDNFRKHFEKIIGKVCGQEAIDSGKRILSSYEILENTGGDMKAHEKIFNALRKEPIRINVFYTSFNQQRIPKIKAYGRIGTREMTVDEFLDDHLRNAFNHICAWKILGYIHGVKATVFLDNFFTYVTNAWEELKKEFIALVPSGDRCDHLICAADIILAHLEHKLKAEKRSLFINTIAEALGFSDEKEHASQLQIHIITNKHLHNITPLDKKNQFLPSLIRHPAFFLIKAKGTDTSLDMILSGSDGLVNDVCERKGSVCFFHDRSHKNVVKDGDVFVYFDDEGRRTAELWKKITGKNINISKYEDFRQKRGNQIETTSEA